MSQNQAMCQFRNLIASEPTIYCLVRVDRSRSPKETIGFLGNFTNNNVVESMPRGEGEEVTVAFFRINRHVTDDELEQEYHLRGLKPADPYSLAAVNRADPSFMRSYDNATHWKDTKGRWCDISFEVFPDGGNSVGVDYSEKEGWCANAHWFAGLRE